MDQLQGKVAVVTGGGSGIGRAMALRFAEQGVHIALADVDNAALATVAEEVRALGVRALAIPTDVSSAAAVEGLLERTLSELGGVHIVCNNAGVDSGATVAEIPLSAWDWVLGVNLYGVIHGVRTFLPHLMKQGEGHIVNTSSIAAFSGIPVSAAPYVASKAAVMGLTRNLRLELMETAPNIGVTLLLPGPVRTNMPQSERNRPSHVEVPPPSELRDKVQEVIKTLVKDAADPMKLAADVVDAVRHNRPTVLTDEADMHTTFEALEAEVFGASRIT